jgi:hypothetical protein
MSDGAKPESRGNLEPQTLFKFVVADFEATWNALVAGSNPRGAGANFMLAKQAMVLLELSSRVATAEGPNGVAIRQFSEHLAVEESRYFLELPCAVRLPRDFTLPFASGTPPERQLWPLLYDLVRNGQAHYYQQLAATLSDGSTFAGSITGAERGMPTIETCRHDPSYRKVHLDLIEQPNTLWLRIQPEALFIDVMLAARRASLFTGMLPLVRFSRQLDCTRADLRAALAGE